MVISKQWSVLVTSTYIFSLFMTSIFLYAHFTLADAATRQNYIKPTRSIPHLTDQVLSHTLEDYASQQDQYFINDTIFYLYPGIHTLNRNIDVKNVHNLTIQGLSSSEPVIVVLGSLVSIIWKKCSCIKISAFDFYLADNFTHSIVFELTQSVQLSNVSMFGNGSSGCSSILSRKSTLDINNSNFVGIKGLIGSALMISGSSIVTFVGNNRFESNKARLGGAIHMHNSTLTFNGNSHFINNTANWQNVSILIDALCNTSLTELVDQNWSSGGAIFSNKSALIINNESNFIQNIAEGDGGAISAIYGKMTIRGSALFDRNYAVMLGGAIDLLNTTSEFSVNGTISFFNNKANDGGAIHVLEYGNVFFRGETTSADSQNFMDACQKEVYSCDIIFHGNIAIWTGGAIKSYSHNNITVSGTLCFESNVASSGGAIALDTTSKLILTPVLAISFVMNHAFDSGGAIFIDNDKYLSSSDCFLSIRGHHSNRRANVSLCFINNSADKGSTLFGGELNKCRLCYQSSTNLDYTEISSCKYHSSNALETFINISSIYLHNNSLNNISSPAQSLKLCQSDDRNNFYKDIYVHPGEEFNITLNALGQTGSAVPAIIVASERFSNNEYSLSPRYQQIRNLCTNASFRLYLANQSIDCIYVDLDFDSHYQNFNKITVQIHIIPCPLAFTMSVKDRMCVCDYKLSKFVQNCYIDSRSIERMRNNFWVSKSESTLIILHEFHCPLDYCKFNPVNVTLDKSNVQCNFNRTGMLCGCCQNHYSLALGSLHCVSCSNHYISLMLPFSLVGVLLVAIVFIFNLTVAVGTLNGLLFYANIIQANHQAFIPRDTINFFTMFISWLNLDLGIETCFYDGMDIYAYSWLQFLFPFYVWCLIGCIILVSRYSQSFARSLGQNPVAVLATLLLMSFSKILTAIITPLSWTYLTYYNSTNESRRIVWLYDGSMDFFKEPKHTLLGTFAIFTLVVFVLPYIILLFCGHWLQGLSNKCALSWLNKLKPLMDAYYAPYKGHTRYRTGLLLLTRLGLFLTFAINTLGSESINILAVSSVTTVLLAMQVGRVYEHWWNDLLECSYLLNLGIFSAATFYIKEEIKHDEHDQSQLILSSISVGAAFATFLGILLVHIYFTIKSTRFWKVHMRPRIHKIQLLTRMLKTTIERENSVTLQESTESHTMPTSTIVDVDLCEPLIDTTCH